MAPRFAIPFLILAVLVLPWPFVFALFIFSVFLAVRPRGEPCPDPAPVRRWEGPALLRSPPR